MIDSQEYSCNLSVATFTYLTQHELISLAGSESLRVSIIFSLFFVVGVSDASVNGNWIKDTEMLVQLLLKCLNFFFNFAHLSSEGKI